jgi:hypothetical protein
MVLEAAEAVAVLPLIVLAAEVAEEAGLLMLL